MSPPDFLIGFARGADAVRSLVEQSARTGTSYRKVAALDVYGVDMTRPEMFWRSFVQMPVRNMEQDGIHIWRR